MHFIALDVETANADMASICQIGIAKYRDGVLTDEWVSLIDPEDYFDYLNIGIHEIDEDMVDGAPIFPDVLDKIKSFTEDTICVCHTHFDRVSLDRAFNKYEITPFEITWLDSARVARRTWEDCAWSGYGLADLCKKIGYEFKHHDALEDAKACAQVLLTAINETQIDIDGWLNRVRQPINPEYRKPITRDGDPEGELYGEIMVFTGALHMHRREAADLAAKIGCQVTSGVTKKTTMLVVGDQDIKKLAGKEKSSKHIKAEQLIYKGQSIRIIKESDFMELVRHSEHVS